MSNEINIVNGSVVGVHLGTPMQDATPIKPEDNEVYATERNTVTRIPNGVETWDDQPVQVGGSSGGGDSEAMLDALIDGSITEITSDIAEIGNYAFYFRSALTSVTFPNVTNIGDNAFNNCTNLTNANFPNVKTIGAKSFNKCTNLTSVTFPNATNLYASSFNTCSNLIIADFPNVTSIANTSFAMCSKLTAFVLRNHECCELGGTGVFNGTPISYGTGGYIYVPRALVDTYKGATNWASFATQIRALEDYTVDGTITGELDESKI